MHSLLQMSVVIVLVFLLSLCGSRTVWLLWHLVSTQPSQFSNVVFPSRVAVFLTPAYAESPLMPGMGILFISSFMDGCIMEGRKTTNIDKKVLLSLHLSFPVLEMINEEQESEIHDQADIIKLLQGGQLMWVSFSHCMDHCSTDFTYENVFFSNIIQSMIATS